MTIRILWLNTHIPYVGWIEALRKHLPHGWELATEPSDDIRHVIACQPPPDVLDRLPHLQYVHSMWAGVDHIPKRQGVTIFRMVDPGLVQSMMDYITGHVYRYHLEMPQYASWQAERKWNQVCPPLCSARVVGVMGIGVLGSKVAAQLASLGFCVVAWSRTGSRTVPKVEEHYSGPDDLEDFLASTQVLVMLLPDTPETTDILSRETIAHLPHGAAVINAGRGNAVDESAVLEALDSGKLSGVTLDVFKEEPLPVDHAFWSHPRVTVTPHVAAEVSPETAIPAIYQTISALEGGASSSTIEGVYNPGLGY